MNLSLELICHAISKAKPGELLLFFRRNNDDMDIPIFRTDNSLVTLTGVSVNPQDIFNWNVTGFKLFSSPGEFLKSIGWTPPAKKSKF